MTALPLRALRHVTPWLAVALALLALLAGLALLLAAALQGLRRAEQPQDLPFDTEAFWRDIGRPDDTSGGRD